MNDAKYIGLDVHQATISAAAVDSTGKLVMECILETRPARLWGSHIPITRRIIKGRPFRVGLDCSHQRLQRGAPL